MPPSFLNGGKPVTVPSTESTQKEEAKPKGYQKFTKKVNKKLFNKSYQRVLDCKKGRRKSADIEKAISIGT